MQASSGEATLLGVSRIPILTTSPQDTSIVTQQYVALKTVAQGYLTNNTRIIIVIGSDMEFTLFTLAACQLDMTHGYVFIGWNLPPLSSYQPPRVSLILRHSVSH